MVTNSKARTNTKRESQRIRPAKGDTARFNRSALSNGSRILPKGIDGRSAEARRWKDVYRDAMDRTGGRCEQACRSYASLVVEREAFDADIAQGYVIDRWELVRLTNAIDRLERRLGLDKPNRESERERIAREDREALLR